MRVARPSAQEKPGWRQRWEDQALQSVGATAKLQTYRPAMTQFCHPWVLAWKIVTHTCVAAPEPSSQRAAEEGREADKVPASWGKQREKRGITSSAHSRHCPDKTTRPEAHKGQFLSHISCQGAASEVQGRSGRVTAIPSTPVLSHHTRCLQWLLGYHTKH